MKLNNFPAIVFVIASSCFGAFSCDDGPGLPLFLTPYIKAGNFSQAKQLAQVPPLLPGMESYAGFITVDDKNNGSMYFWHIRTKVFPKKTNFLKTKADPELLRFQQFSKKTGLSW